MVMTSMLPESKTITLKSGRTLGYAEYGHPSGIPIIGFHGMPASRIMLKVFENAALASGARLIAPERPGYGLSQPSPAGTLLSYPDEVQELADALGLDRFTVMGVSGGGPYALACAYRLPGRLKVAGVVSGIGPLSLPGSRRDMIRNNRVMFTLGCYSPALAAFLICRLIKSSLPSMEKHIRQGTSPAPDLSPEIFAILAADQRQAIGTGGQGVALDMKTLWRPWGFQFEDIRTKVNLWHGEADNLAPAHLARYIAQRIPDCQAVYYPGESHTDPLIKHADEIMTQLVGADRPS